MTSSPTLNPPKPFRSIPHRPGRTIVCYHGGCKDGIAAAWVAKLAIADAVLVPCFYGQPPPAVDGEKVYVLDFCWDHVEDVQRLVSGASSVTVLDHHKTAPAILSQVRGDGLRVIYDAKRSGARIAYDYFFPDGNQDIEWIVNNVQDRDLWRHELQESAAVNAYLELLGDDLGKWSEAAELGLGKVADMGQPLLAYRRRMALEIAQRAELVFFDEGAVWACNAVILWSDVAAEMLRQRGGEYAVTYRRRQDGRWEYSLASAGQVDVSEIAKKYGGGGHASAAGFESVELVHRPVMRDG